MCMDVLRVLWTPDYQLIGWLLNGGFANLVCDRFLGNQSLRASGEVHRIRLPRRIREICSTDPERARQVQLRLSEEFQQHLHGSWAVTGFELDEQYGSYLLEQYDD